MFLQTATFAIAVLGAVLGVLNTWRGLNADRVRMRVRTYVSLLPGEKEESLGIEVVNLSSFAVTVEEIGWIRPRMDRLVVALPRIATGERLLVPLEPRASFTGYAPPGAHKHPDFAYINYAFASTACGVTRRGSSELLTEVAQLAAASKKQPAIAQALVGPRYDHDVLPSALAMAARQRFISGEWSR